MPGIAAAGTGFLLCVLWFDLMFDIQVRGHRGPTLPPDVLASIRGYYRRVTIDASPMGSLVSLVMLITLGAIIAEVVQGRSPTWAGWVSPALALIGIGLAAGRIFANARRLARGADGPEKQSLLARLIYRDHLICLSAMTGLMIVQLFVGF